MKTILKEGNGKQTEINRSNLVHMNSGIARISIENSSVEDWNKIDQIYKSMNHIVIEDENQRFEDCIITQLTHDYRNILFVDFEYSKLTK